MDMPHPRTIAFEQPVGVRQKRSAHERKIDVVPVDGDVAEALRDARRCAVEKGDRIRGSEEGFLTRGHFADDELSEPLGKRSDGRIVRLQELGECPLRALPPSLARFFRASAWQALPSLAHATSPPTSSYLDRKSVV